MRKKLIMTTMAAALLALNFSGCSNDEKIEGGKGEPGSGEKSMVAINLINATSSTVSRAAGDETGLPTPEESQLSNQVRVIVYGKDGAKEHDQVYTLDWEKNAQGIDEASTPNFTLMSGAKKFYVFLNEPDASTGNTIDGTKPKDNSFETQVFKDALTDSRPVIATDNKFFIGTLWGEETIIHGGATATDPQVVNLTIGRLAAKVRLNAVKEAAGGNLKGTFDGPKYTLGAVANEYNLVGQYEGTIAPPKAGHGKVISSVHTEGATSSKFTNYNYDDATKWTPVPSTPEAPFYALENTTAVDNSKYQYYGNTTHVQLEVAYHPVAAEIYDLPTAPGVAPALDPTGEQTITANGGTFYTGEVNQITYIFAKDPTGNPALPDFKKYDAGKNYYRFPIRDMSEAGDVEKKNAVLRNHIYDLEVLEITKLGSNEIIDNKTQPIPEESEVVLKVNVSQWSRIYHGVIL